MSIEQITDYGIKNKPPWLIEYFKDSNIKGILEADDQQFNEIEGTLFDMLSKLWIDDATGEQLDVIGIHIGLDRNGREDDIYRTLIKTKIEVNVGSGQPEKVIEVIRILFETTTIEYTPEYPAKFWLWFDADFAILIYFNIVDDEGDTLVDDLGNTIIGSGSDSQALSILNQVIPSGVGLLIAYRLIDNNGNFIVDNNGNNIVGTIFFT